MLFGSVRTTIVLWCVHCFTGLLLFKHSLEAELWLRLTGLSEQILLVVTLRVKVQVCQIHAAAVQFLVVLISKWFELLLLGLG